MCVSVDLDNGLSLQDGSVPCAYRIAQEGLPLLLPFITRQRVTLSAADFLRLLTERSVPVIQQRGATAVASPEGPTTPAAAAATSAADDPELSGVHIVLCLHLRHGLHRHPVPTPQRGYKE